MSFLNNLKDTLNVTTTLNYAKAYESTKSEILDLYSMGGASRSKSDQEVTGMIIRALAEDPVLATKAIFYLADIREGQGERRLFRLALPEIMEYFEPSEVLSYVPEFSRWDLVIELFNTHEAARTIVNEQIKGNNALFFKWLPSHRAHGKNNPLAAAIRKQNGLSEKEYRKLLKEKRAQLNLVETNLTNKTYDKIDYNKVPSKAGLVYRNAFYRVDKERYTKHVEEAARQARLVAEGKMDASEVTAKVNAGVTYPHEIINKYGYSEHWDWKVHELDSALEAMWLSLPDYLKDSNASILPVIDMSGSMSVPVGPKSNVKVIDVAVGFGMYFAERLKGPFHNHFMSFSVTPRLHKIAGKTLKNRLNSLDKNGWDMNTDIQAVFNKVLETAVTNNLPQDELPNTIIIFSDMEFDYCGRNTNLETAKANFQAAGYELPNLVFWNIHSKTKQTPATMNDKGVVLVSGYSPSVIKFILTGEMTSPYEFMVNTLNTPRYSFVDNLKPKQ